MPFRFRRNPPDRVSQPDPRTAVSGERPGRDMKRALLRRVGIPLIVLGLGVVGFVVGAHYLDDKATQQAQAQLGADFESNQEAATNSTLAPVDDPTVGSTAPTVTVTTTPGEDIAGPDQHPPIPPIIPEVSPPDGEALGRIQIPAASVDWVIVEGVGQDDLALGPGHMPGTALPGQPGNTVISGHRTTHGAPFADLDLLEPGDLIVVETLIGTHTYEVVDSIVVAPTDVWVTNQVDGAWITLTTCHPKGSSRERLIIFGRLVSGPNAEAIAARLTGDESPPQPN